MFQNYFIITTSTLPKKKFINTSQTTNIGRFDGTITDRNVRDKDFEVSL